MINLRTTLLIATTAFLPVVWGWGVHRIMAKLWPSRPSADDGQRAVGRPSTDATIDYQI